MLSAEELTRWCQRTLPDDTRAFETLVEQYKDRVFATIYRMVGNYHDAEEITQEVFVKVYRGIKDLDEPATLSSWIYRIATNACLDALEKRRARPQGPLHDDLPMGAHPLASAPGPSPEHGAMRNELQRCLERTLHSLPFQERSLLVLRDVEGRPYQEIAETLAIGLSAVKMRIHRARLAFQRAFEALCPGLRQASTPG